MDFDEMRKKMVKEQLVSRGISDRRTLDAFLKVARHIFVPPNLSASAYADNPLPIGFGQTISQPYMAALMTECLRLKGGEKVLEIGTGSGYQAAILAEIVSMVYSVERCEELAERSGNALNDLGYKNIEIETGDGTLGWEENAPYDAIIVTAGAPDIPKSLIRQLAEGGRLVIPVGDTHSQVLRVCVKDKYGAASDAVCGCTFVPLIGKEGWVAANG